MDGVTISSLLGSGLGLLLAVRLTVSRTENRVGAWTLAGFFTCGALLVLDSTFYRHGWFEQWPWFYGVANPFIAASGPLFYLYACATTDPAFRWRWKTWLHLIPSALFSILQIPVLFLSTEEKLQLAESDLQPAASFAVQLASVGVFDLYLLIYFGFAWWRFWHHRDRIVESREEGRSHPLRGIGAFATVLLVLNIVSAILDFTPWMQTGMTMLALAAVLGFFAIFWTVSDPGMLVQLARTPRPVVLGMEDNATAGPASVQGDSGPAVMASPVVKAAEPEPDAETRRLAVKLTRLMETDRPYLDAGLSLHGIAEQLGTTRHRASEAIRCAYNATFYQVVAAHRVRAAASVLRTTEGRARTIADVAFSVGFNTLSAFNLAFRTEFGMTPKVFRETMHGSDSIGKSAGAPFSEGVGGGEH